MTIEEIERKLGMLFTWAEREFRERNEKASGEDAMEAAMLMDAILTTLVAIWVARLPA